MGRSRNRHRLDPFDDALGSDEQRIDGVPRERDRALGKLGRAIDAPLSAAHRGSQLPSQR